MRKNIWSAFHLAFLSLIFLLFIIGCESDGETNHSDGDADIDPAETEPETDGDAETPFEDGDASETDLEFETDGDREAEADAFDVDTAVLDAYILDRMEAGFMPAASIAVVNAERLCFAKGYGYANLEDRQLANMHTIFMLASVSKTFIATAFMQAVEDGLLDLDDPVNDHLPFPVVHPGHPDTAITLRMLLTHTSSIKDNWDVLRAGYMSGDCPVALEDSLRDYLTPDGAHYDAEKHFLDDEPGSVHKYSNIGASLAALAIQHVSGKDFREFTEEHIFQPLGMSNTGWRLQDIDTDNLAMPYLHDMDTGDLLPEGQYGYPDYPSGALRTSSVQLARFLRAYINNGEMDGERILSEASVDEIRRVQFPDLDNNQGLLWNYRGMGLDERFGHAGNDEGVTTYMYIRESDRIGVIVLTSGDTAQDLIAYMAFSEIFDRVTEEAAGLCEPVE